MDWDRIREQWQRQPADAGTMAIDVLRRRDDALARRLRLRDRIELVAAVVVVVAFSGIGFVAALERAWLELVFAGWLVAWAVSIPVWLHRGRIHLVDADPAEPLLRHLERRRQLAITQARMLERAWLWYVAPAMVGLVGLTLAASGPTPRALTYLGTSLLLGAAIAWWNHHVARTRFRRHADALQQQIEALSATGPQPAEPTALP